jgi:hypothetical protein
MEPEGSLPCSQEPVYPGSDESCPRTSYFFKIQFLILSFCRRLSISNIPFTSGFLTKKLCRHFSSVPCMLHAPPILFNLNAVIVVGEKYKLWGRHYVVSSSLLLISPS